MNASAYNCNHVQADVPVIQSESVSESEYEYEGQNVPEVDVGNKTTRKRFVPPTVEEVAAYCRERGNRINAQQFVDHYASNGWVVGHSKMKDWRAAVRTWEHRDNANCSSKTKAPPIPGTIHC